MSHLNNSKHLLLFSEKEPSFIEVVKELEVEGFVVHHLSTLSEVISFLQIVSPEVIVLDSSRKEIACLELCHVLRSNTAEKKNLTIVISDRYDEKTEVEAFRAGADDFMTKPLKVASLIERIKTRRSIGQSTIAVQQKLNHSRIRIDRESYSVFLNNDPLNLSRKEFELLFLLASRPGRIFTKEELSEKVWKRKMNDNERTIDVHILRIRKKLGRDVIYTQKGIGYKFTV